MKNPIIVTGVIVLLMNLLAGLLLTAYPWFNVALNSCVITITCLLLLTLGRIGLRTAFQISLSYFFIILLMIQIILGILSPQRMQDNLCIIVILAILALEVILIITFKTINNHNKTTEK